MKKVTSLILSVVFIFLTSFPVSAENASKEIHNEDPIVVVRGIDFAGLVKEDGSKAISVDYFDILNLIFTIVGHKINGDKDAVAKSIVSFGNDIFRDVVCDKEGNPSNPEVHIPKFYESAANYDLSGDEWADTAVGLFRSCANTFESDRVYLYTFDWRKSPSELADELNEFFKSILEKTGEDKLDIAACSMGGMITTAYIDKYGTDKLDTVTYLSSAHNGGHLIGSAFTGDLTIDSDFLGQLLRGKTENNFFINLIIKLFDFLGVFEGVAKIVNNFLVTHKDYIYDNFLCETFATAYGLWALVPDEYFDDAVNFFFDGKDGYDKALTEIAKVRDFVYSTDSIINKACASDTKVTFVSHYNSEQLPIYSRFFMHGDGVLETDRTSGYGTIANFGDTLSDKEINGVAAEYISPDKVINASTCLHSETTWFVKNAKHVGCKDGSDHTEFAIWLLTSKEQPTVNSNAAYPRFLNADKNENFISF